jgi:hypothetical protein
VAARPRDRNRPGTIGGLLAEGPDPSLREKLMLFGQFVGDWEVRTEWFLPDGTRPKGTGEIHVGWILNGTAVQDVWMGRFEDPPRGSPGTSFGTTLRFIDPDLDAWRCIWIAPTRGVVQTFVGRKVGDEIVLEGETREGHPERWIFSEITPRSFEWQAVESHDGKRTWELTEKTSARRVGPPRTEGPRRSRAPTAAPRREVGTLGGPYETP